MSNEQHTHIYIDREMSREILGLASIGTRLYEQEDDHDIGGFAAYEREVWAYLFAPVWGDLNDAEREWLTECLAEFAEEFARAIADLEKRDTARVLRMTPAEAERHVAAREARLQP